MKYLVILTMSCFCGMCLTLTSCGESSQERSQREQIDSLEHVYNLERMRNEDLHDYLAIIADGLDSISIEEKEIFVKDGNTERRGFNRQRMKQQLAHVREILARHRARIDELEQKLATGTGEEKKLHSIIVALKQQIEQKDAELLQLRADLDNSKKDISELKTQVAQMTTIQEEQQSVISEQNEKIQHQESKLYNGYIKIASNKQLKAEGLLEGGKLFKRSKVDYSKIDLSSFDVIDIRNTTTIPVPKKAKILTPVPNGSYTISNGTLTITDSAQFWSVSNFLIIQTD